jgi:hypothetical protein
MLFVTYHCHPVNGAAIVCFIKVNIIYPVCHNSWTQADIKYPFLNDRNITFTEKDLMHCGFMS